MSKKDCMKSATISAQELTDEDLALINTYTLEPVTKEAIYTFKMSMTNNDIDRDYERNSLGALNQLKSLFIGKTVIADHIRSSKNQAARIYKTELRTSNTILDCGEQFTELIAYAYMLDNEENKGLIDSIKAGIRKEVSIGYRSKTMICSICGKDNRKEYCSHYWGRDYNGKTCYFTFDDIEDAYEVSFVAVPAVRGAGTTKSHDEHQNEVKEKQEAIARNIKMKAKLFELGL